jgi:hypothetical protein
MASGACSSCDGRWWRGRWCCGWGCFDRGVEGGGAAISFASVLSFLGKNAKDCRAFLTRFCSTAPRADVEASVTSASGADGSGCASSVVRDKFAFQSSKALRSSGVQVMG